MSRLERWLVVFLAAILITAIASYLVLSARFAMPQYIPINCYLV